MKFSYTAAWEDLIALLRAHATLIAALAGVFIFLPALLVGHFLPQPVPADDIQRYILLLREYISANWPWLLLQGLLNMLGSLAILMLVFARKGTTVAAAIAAAAALLPFYFIASLLSTVMIAIGLALLIVPGLYLIGRLAPLAPVMVAENRRNPIDAIRRSFEVTKGRGWAVLGLVVLVAIAGTIVVTVVNMVFGTVFRLVGGADVGTLLRLIVTSATAAAFTVVMLLLYAAIYRQLSDRSEAPAAD